MADVFDASPNPLSLQAVWLHIFSIRLVLVTVQGIWLQTITTHHAMVRGSYYPNTGLQPRPNAPVELATHQVLQGFC